MCIIYRLHDDDSDLYDHVQTLTFNGAVETVAFSKVHIYAKIVLTNNLVAVANIHVGTIHTCTYVRTYVYTCLSMYPVDPHVSMFLILQTSLKSWII